MFFPLTPAACADLLRPLSTSEILSAVNSFKLFKAPRPDGLHPLFYQHYWTEVGPKVIDFCHHIFLTFQIPEPINQTYVCLIPKVPNASMITQYRSIDLCPQFIKS